MRACEIELARLIRDSKDPVKTMIIAVDVIQRVLSGENETSILASYGVIAQEPHMDASIKRTIQFIRERILEEGA